MGKQASAAFGAQRETAWRDRLARYAASKQTVEAFCRREAVPVGTFYGWRARLRARDGPGPRPVASLGLPRRPAPVDGAQAPQTAPALSPSPFLDLGSVNGLAASAAAPGRDHVAPHARTDIEVRVELGGGLVLHIVRH